MPSSTQAECYLLSVLEFDVGSLHAKFYGAIKVTNAKDAYFFLSDKMQFDPKLLPAGEVTQSITNPFNTDASNPGMKGVELSGFDAKGHIYQKDNKTVVDLELTAAASFPALQNLLLEGALVFDGGAPRLAWVELDVVNPQGEQQPPLTLTQFVQAVIGGDWSWGADATNQFAFQSGYMYYLSGSDNYTFNYTEGGASKTLQCVPGYHFSATLQVFQQYDFEIDLDVAQDDTITLTGKYLDEIDFGFVQFTNLRLQIATGQSTHFRLATDAVVFGSKFSIFADYSNPTFFGQVTAEDVNITVKFSWTQGSAGGSFAILEIDGLPLRDLDIVRNLLNAFNNSGGCDKILSEWLSKIKSTFTPALNGSPSRNIDGSMKLPLKLTYAIRMGDSSPFVTAEIDFDAYFDVPTSLSNLPDAMWNTIIDNLDNIIPEILSNQNTYKAIAMEVAKRAGGKALARFICRSLESDNNDTAEDLAEPSNVDLVPIETLGDAAELVGVLMTVSLIGISLVYSLLKDIWDDIKKFFGGGDSDKDKARDQIRAVWDKVNQTIAPINQKIEDIKTDIKIVSLTTGIDEQSRFEAQVVWSLGISQKLDPGSVLSCNFDFLSGAPGNDKGQILGTEIQNQTFPLVKNWSDINSGWNYELNARVQTALTGYTFMKPDDRATIVNAINLLNSAPSDIGVAHDFAASLQSTLDQFDGFNQKGLLSDWVYAQSDTPLELVVGQSRVGINTRI
jgi:hypothetical protein